jgi:hypothetical protein
VPVRSAHHTNSGRCDPSICIHSHIHTCTHATRFTSGNTFFYDIKARCENFLDLNLGYMDLDYVHHGMALGLTSLCVGIGMSRACVCVEEVEFFEPPVFEMTRSSSRPPVM